MEPPNEPTPTPSKPIAPHVCPRCGAPAWPTFRSCSATIIEVRCDAGHRTVLPKGE